MTQLTFHLDSKTSSLMGCFNYTSRVYIAHLFAYLLHLPGGRSRMLSKAELRQTPLV